MKFQDFQTGVNQRGSFSGVGRGVGMHNRYLLRIIVDHLEAIMQYELISNGNVIVRDRDDGLCISSPDLCSLPAGAKSPKESDKKKKSNLSLKPNYPVKPTTYAAPSFL